jgi:hypothetical protein
MTTLSELRRTFAHSPDCEIVSPETYLQRLTEQLVRADEPSANLLGLMDEQTGSRILVPAEAFVRRQTASGASW